MAVNLSPIGNFQFVDTTTGNPSVGAKLFTYQAGTSTKTATYTDNTGSTSHTNPIVLNADGRAPNPIYLTDAVGYKFVLAAPTDSDPPTSPLYTWDNVFSIASSSPTVTATEWIAGTTPSFISATSFSVVGDQTVTLHVGRRIRAAIGAGNRYGTIITSSFGAGITTITLTLDSGALDGTLSNIFYGWNSGENPSVDVKGAKNAASLIGENAFTKVSAAGVKPALALGPGSVNPGWSTDFHVQQIGPQTYIARQIGNGTVWIANNASYDNTNWRAIGTGRGELISIVGGTAGPYDTKTFNLDNGSGGTVAAGGIFTLTDMGSLVRIESSGNANTLVRRNASGNILNSYYNMTADDIGTETPSRVPVETGTDGFLRWQTLANFNNVLRKQVFSITTAGAGTFTVPTGATSLLVKGQGGGGGGADGGGGAGGGGGGAGGFDELLILSPAASYAYSIGAGGAGGGNGASGSPGGSTSFNGIVLGTGGGAGLFSSTGGVAGTGKLGGTGVFAGGQSTSGTSGAGGAASTTNGGGGGSSPLGSGGNAGTPATAGGVGAGGGGGNDNAAVTSAAGGAGAIIIYVTY